MGRLQDSVWALIENTISLHNEILSGPLFVEGDKSIKFCLLTKNYTVYCMVDPDKNE